MKRFLALLALVLVLMAGTAGMASAATIGFDSTPPGYDPTKPPNFSYPPGISGTTVLYWDGTGSYGGHLMQGDCTLDSTISFTGPTYVNNFQMNGHAYTPVLPEDLLWYIYGPMTITALNADGLAVWTQTVSFDAAHRDMANPAAWLTVNVNTAGVSSIIFYAVNPECLEAGPFFWPSIDNLVINEAAAVPIPASVWLLGSGLLALVGLRRKSSR